MNCAKRAEPTVGLANCAWVQGFLDELFHDLGQPLTALHCSLEIALKKDGGEQELRQALCNALSLSEKALKMVSAERGMLDATRPGKPVLIDLSEAARTAAEEMRPVSEYAGKEILVSADQAAYVRADPQRVTQSLFAMLDLSLARLGSAPQLLISIFGSRHRIMCYVGANRAPLPGLLSSIELRAFRPGGAAEAVGRMVAAEGGSSLEIFLPNYYAFVLSFPRALAEEGTVSDASI